MPVVKIMGRNTIIVVIVEAEIAIPISDAPWIAALSRNRPPVSSFRVIFSMMTMALSTTMPIAMARDISEITLMVYPSMNMALIDTIRENGMVNDTIRDDRKLPRNRKVTSMTRMPP